VTAFQGRVVATAHHVARPVFEAELTGTVALLFGNEGSGLSAPLLEAAHDMVSIPMPGKAESLNVAAAAAILLYERARQLSTSAARS